MKSSRLGALPGVLGNGGKSALGCHEGKNVPEQGGEGLVINQGGLGPALWGQDIGHVTLAQSFPKMIFSTPPRHFCLPINCLF